MLTHDLVVDAGAPGSRDAGATAWSSCIATVRSAVGKIAARLLRRSVMNQYSAFWVARDLGVGVRLVEVLGDVGRDLGGDPVALGGEADLLGARLRRPDLVDQRLLAGRESLHLVARIEVTCNGSKVAE